MFSQYFCEIKDCVITGYKLFCDNSGFDCILQIFMIILFNNWLIQIQPVQAYSDN